MFPFIILRLKEMALKNILRFKKSEVDKEATRLETSISVSIDILMQDELDD